MSRQMPFVTYNISSNRAVKCLLGCHKALNRAHLGSCPDDGVSSDGMPSNSIIFDVYLTSLKVVMVHKSCTLLFRHN